MRRRSRYAVGLSLGAAAASLLLFLLRQHSDAVAPPGAPSTRARPRPPAPADVQLSAGGRRQAESSAAGDAEPTTTPTSPPRASRARGTVRATAYGHGAPWDGVLLEVVVIGADGAPRRARVVAGEAVVEDVPPGPVTATLDAAGYVSARASAVVPDVGGEVALGLRMEPGAAIVGRVVAAESGSPVARARVRVFSGGAFGGTWSQEGGAITDPVLTDDDGRFVTPAVAFDDVVTVEGVALGHARERVATRLQRSAGERPPLVLRLAPGATVTGRVVTADGAAVADVAVYVFGADWDEQRRDPAEPSWDDESHTPPRRSFDATSGADGRFEVHGLPLGLPWCATAVAGGGVRAADVCGPALATAGARAEATLRLPSVAGLEVLVLDPARAPVAGGHVEVLGKGAADEISAPLGADGVARFPSLPGGVAVVRVRLEGFVPVEVPVRVAAGATWRETIVLDRGVEVAGRVVDEDGKPLARMWVRAERPGARVSPEAWDHSDATGAFRIRGLARATYTVSAFSPELGGSERTTVRPPADDLRLVLRSCARVVARLVVPTGVAPPATVRAQNEDAERGGGRGGAPVAFGDGGMQWYSPSGRRRLRLHTEGFAPLELVVDVPTSGTVDLGAVPLDVGVSAEGTVVDLTGRPVAGAEVEVSGHAIPPLQVGADGRFRFEHVQRGRVAFHVACEGFLARWTACDLATEPGPVTLRIARGALVRGRVRTSDARAADLRVVRTDGEGSLRVQSAEPDGFSVRVPEGTWSLQSRRGDEPRVLANFTAVEGATLDLGDLGP